MNNKEINTVGTLFKKVFPFMFNYRIRPKEPELNMCCGCSCKNCVWIVYYNKLEEFEKNNI